MTTRYLFLRCTTNNATDKQQGGHQSKRWPTQDEFTITEEDDVYQETIDFHLQYCIPVDTNSTLKGIMLRFFLKEQI